MTNGSWLHAHFSTVLSVINSGSLAKTQIPGCTCYISWLQTVNLHEYCLPFGTQLFTEHTLNVCSVLGGASPGMSKDHFNSLRIVELNEQGELCSLLHRDLLEQTEPRSLAFVG